MQVSDFVVFFDVTRGNGPAVFLWKPLRSNLPRFPSTIVFRVEESLDPFLELVPRKCIQEFIFQRFIPK
jgi:hypothetical protein